MFTIINKQTGQQVGTAKTLTGARRSKDRRDMQYGAYVHSIRDEDGRSRI